MCPRPRLEGEADLHEVQPAEGGCEAVDHEVEALVAQLQDEERHPRHHVGKQTEHLPGEAGAGVGSEAAHGEEQPQQQDGIERQARGEAPAGDARGDLERDRHDEHHQHPLALVAGLQQPRCILEHGTTAEREGEQHLADERDRCEPEEARPTEDVPLVLDELPQHVRVEQRRDPLPGDDAQDALPIGVDVHVPLALPPTQ